MASRRVVVLPAEAPSAQPAVLSGQQDQVIGLLLAGKTQREAATEAGCAEETVSRWANRDPLFMATLNARRRELWQGNVDRLRALTSEAIDVVRDVLRTVRNPPDDGLRLRAALAVLKAGAMDQTEPPAEEATDPDRVALALKKRRPSTLDLMMAEMS